MTDYPVHVLENILSAIGEDKRLQSLSNEELVREYLARDSEVDDEPYTSEMCNRLWPEWAEIEL